MLAEIWGWLKRNWLSAGLFLVIIYLLNRSGQIRPLSQGLREATYKNFSSQVAPFAGGSMNSDSFLPEPVPAPEIKDRLVIQNSYLSLKVKDVSDSLTKIKVKAEALDGYLVEASLSKPEETSSGNITVRIPTAKLDEFLSFCRNLALKVVSETLEGYDVTDQFIDTQKRLETLERTKRKFEEMLDKTVEVQEILQVQREITNLQEQIDKLKGQNQYLEQNAKLVKVTVYLASDELALPYAPSEAWRPGVIFKTAVRTLILALRKVGTILIWSGVFSVLWIPLSLFIYFVHKKIKSKKQF